MSDPIWLCAQKCCPRLEIGKDGVVIFDDTIISPPDELYIRLTIWNSIIDKVLSGELKKLDDPIIPSEGMTVEHDNDYGFVRVTDVYTPPNNTDHIAVDRNINVLKCDPRLELVNYSKCYNCDMVVASNKTHTCISRASTTSSSPR